MKRNRNVKLHSISTSTTITSTINPFLLSTLIINGLVPRLRGHTSYVCFQNLYRPTDLADRKLSFFQPVSEN